MTPSDTELMQQIVARKQEAFSILFERYQVQVTEQMRRMMRDPEVADDLTQEVFLRVWNRADQWSGKGSFRGWLFRIAKNLALNQLRSKSRRREQPLEMPSLHGDEDEERTVPGWMIDRASLGPDIELERSEQRQMLQKMIAQTLSPPPTDAIKVWDARLMCLMGRKDGLDRFGADAVGVVYCVFERLQEVVNTLSARDIGCGERVGAAGCVSFNFRLLPQKIIIDRLALLKRSFLLGNELVLFTVLREEIAQCWAEEIIGIS